MSYQALYRKYRSKTFDELVGQEAIVRTLKNAIETEKIAHAYLFSGPRGTGKTSVARLFAKALNCEKGLGHQCNECNNCIEINEGSHPDVIEIDAASNSGVKNARELIETVTYAPIEGRYKVYIIDEVHMLTPEAFNALLKTLEEPPKNVVFILCTTEAYRVLPTIVSRCQRYEFKKIEDNDLVRLIKTVLTKEKIKATDECIELIAELANGGARDALSLLDQVIAYSQDNINLEDVEKIFGLVQAQEKIDLLTYIHNGDTFNALNLNNALINKNIDYLRLVDELLLELKDALINKITNNANLNLSTSADLVKKISNIFTATELNTLIDLFIECQKQFKISANPHFTFEIYLLKALTLFKEGISENKTTMTRQVEAPKPKILKTPVVEKPIEIPKKVPEIEKNPAEPQQNFEKPQNKFTLNSISDDDLIKLLTVANKDTKNSIKSLWQGIEDYVDDPVKGDAARHLIDCSLFSTTNKFLIVVGEYDKATKFINNASNQSACSSLIKDITKKEYFVYALTRAQSKNLKDTFMSLREANNLPDTSKINENDIQITEVTK